MAFRKRNVAVNNAASPSGPAAVPGLVSRPQILPGTRPSSLGSHTVTSTGTSELDGLLGGHGGLTLGCSLLIGEHGTTDYSGAILRAYAAEGLLQGHQVHVIAAGKPWAQNLPGTSDGDSRRTSKASDAKAQEEKMKIAWRYENMERASSRSLPVRSISATTGGSQDETPFCHTFDLTRRLEPTPEHKMNHIAISSEREPLTTILTKLAASLASSPPSTYSYGQHASIAFPA
ncbi:hypothetical protein AMS68_004139 [Peltaster fructicola]|uniref:Elongator complex protein 4 n=1 Tax=Peltaster fructicola TaxID=286661 RepID=A0A6H0XV35_9PEZI|nr:hypothetical protein AMS68_004139 [Peltaster fructicola]